MTSIFLVMNLLSSPPRNDMDDSSGDPALYGVGRRCGLLWFAVILGDDIALLSKLNICSRKMQMLDFRSSMFDYLLANRFFAQ